MQINRRRMVTGAAALAASACVPLYQRGDEDLRRDLAGIERGIGGRLGVCFIDPVGGAVLGHRMAERFPVASTFKTSLAALALERAQANDLVLDETVRWSEADLLSYAPFARERVTTGASWRELARAAQVLSDNTAANLLMERLGGPAAVTAFWRRTGDNTSRLDRTEPTLNNVPDGDLRDTTTPEAMARTLTKLVADAAPAPLSPAGADILRDWMGATETGLKRVRAGLPGSWLSGDKTGNSGDWQSMGYARGDIGWCRGPAPESVCFAVYHQAPVGSAGDPFRIDKGFAEVGRLLAGWIRRNYTIIVT